MNLGNNFNGPEIQIFENFVFKCLQRLNIPGAAITIVSKDWESPYCRGFRTKQVGVVDPILADTPFMIGSITKSFTSLLMATCIDRSMV